MSLSELLRFAAGQAIESFFITLENICLRGVAIVYDPRVRTFWAGILIGLVVGNFIMIKRIDSDLAKTKERFNDELLELHNNDLELYKIGALLLDDVKPPQDAFERMGFPGYRDSTNAGMDTLNANPLE